MSVTSSATPRRGFLGTVAAGAAALVAGRWSTAQAEAISSIGSSIPVGDEWVAKIHGTHKQVFDCVETNEGWGPVFGLNYLDTIEPAKKLTDKDVTAVVVMRHFAMPLTLNDATLAEFTPTMEWHFHAVTEAQGQLLAKFGLIRLS